MGWAIYNAITRGVVICKFLRLVLPEWKCCRQEYKCRLHVRNHQLCRNYPQRCPDLTFPVELEEGPLSTRTTKQSLVAHHSQERRRQIALFLSLHSRHYRYTRPSEASTPCHSQPYTVRKLLLSRYPASSAAPKTQDLGDHGGQGNGIKCILQII